MNYMNKKNHLPVFGVGPIYGCSIVAVTVIFIVLSVKGLLPGVMISIFAKRVFFVLGVLVLLEATVLFLGADFAGNLVDSIKENQLKTNGSYRFVRNPCYVAHMLWCTGAILIAHNIVLLVLPFVYWMAMTIMLINTEEKWLAKLYGQEYMDYCKRVNRCIPWFPKKTNGE